MEIMKQDSGIHFYPELLCICCEMAYSHHQELACVPDPVLELVLNNLIGKHIVNG